MTATGGGACLEPILLPLRGKSPEFKAQVFSELTDGQKCLFLFYAYYNHARNSLDEFCWWTAHYLAQPSFWIGLKSRLTEFGEHDIVKFFEDTEVALKKDPINLQTFHLSPNGMKTDFGLQESICSLYTTFRDITPLTLKRLGQYVRNNPDQFVQLQD